MKPVPFEGEPFSQFEPLTVRITNILRQYPDGSQILKELIQNADDAKATHVKIIFDKRSFSTSTLFSDNLRLFQGPSLCVFNNALFEEKDFESIRRLGASRKWEDLGKTGRFGIGFNSTYHITDLPSFVSGPYLVILDPHARYLPGATQCYGKRWDFVSHPTLAQTYPDQFAPYQLLRRPPNQPLEGTLFRFPLRIDKIASQSQISQRPYTEEMVLDLFRNFKNEGSYVLLFLKFVESVELYTIEQGGSEPVLDYSIGIDALQEDLRALRCLMTSLVSKVDFLRTTPAMPLVLHFWIRIKEKEKEEMRQEWVICNCMGGGRAREMAIEEAKSGSLGLPLVPWGGVGGRVPTRGCKEDGKIFCFLPLPTSTSLPIHVNGSYELSLNRRDIWKGEDMGGQGKKKATWNKYLNEDVVSQNYAHFLNAVAKLTSGELIEEYYSLWPRLEKLTTEWEDVGKSMYQKVVENELEVLYCPGYRGNGTKSRWVTVKSGYFIEESLKDENVINFLLSDGLSLVFPPSHVLDGLKPHALKFITPRSVRSFLRESTLIKPGHPLEDSFKDFSDSVLNSLFEYILSDGDIADFEGVPLLLLANGKLERFQSFHKEKSQQFYFATIEEQSLFPNHPQYFISKDINKFVSKIFEGEPSHQLNLSPFSPSVCAQLLQLVIPATWKGKHKTLWKANPTSEEWLSKLWDYITSHSSELHFFLDWPLLPTTDQYLVNLEEDPCIIFPGNTLTVEVQEILKKLGCSIVDQKRFPQLTYSVLRKYTQNGTAAGVLNAISSSKKQNVQNSIIELFSPLSPVERRRLKAFFSRYEWYNTDLTSDKQREQLSALPIFETFNPEKQFSHVYPGCFCPPEGIRDLPAATQLLQRTPDDMEIMKFLKLVVLTRVEFYRSFLLKNIKDLEPILRDSMMVQVFEELGSLVKEDTQFIEHLKALKFVPNGKSLSAPQELFDPEVKLITEVFLDEPVFPVGVYAKPNMLMALRNLGLRSKLSSDIVIERVNSISHLPIDIGVSRAHLLLQYIDQHLDEICDSEYNSFLSKLNVPWFPTITDIKKFPIHHSFCKFNQNFAHPSEVVTRKLFLLASGSKYLFDGNIQNERILNFFGLDMVSMDDILNQINFLKKILKESKNAKNLKKDIPIIMKKIYSYLSKNFTTFQKDIKKLTTIPWIWIEDIGDFVCSNQLVMDSKVDLSPFVNNIPASVSMYHNILEITGVKPTLNLGDYLYVLELIYQSEGKNQIRVKSRSWDIYLSVLNLILSDEEFDQSIVILVPNKKTQFVDRKKVLINDMPWISKQDDKIDVDMLHPKFPVDLANKLEIKYKTHYLMKLASLHIPTQTDYVFQTYSEAVSHATMSRSLIELLNNADDSGATEVKILLDHTTYPSVSLFHKNFGNCQGPALYFYNNKPFSEKDFIAITHPGENENTADLSKIAKFGIGFQYMYNLTHVPSFVSHNSLVIMNESKDIIPQIDENQEPYIRIDCTSNIKSNFPDQLAPYSHFGCISKNNFYGTLFRFPLKASVKVETVKGLLEKFVKKASTQLLFLRHVEKIEILEKHNDLNVVGVVQLKEMTKAMSSFRSFSVQVANFISGKLEDETTNNNTKNQKKGKKKVEQTKFPTHFKPALFPLTISIQNGQEDTVEETWFISYFANADMVKSVIEERALYKGKIPFGMIAGLMSLQTDQRANNLWTYSGSKIFTGLPVTLLAGFDYQYRKRSVKISMEKKMGQWNSLIVNECLVFAYENFMLETAKYISDKGFPHSIYYRHWPYKTMTNVDPLWEQLIKKTNQLLFQKKSVFIHGSNNLVLLDEAFYSVLQPDEQPNPTIKSLYYVIQNIYCPLVLIPHYLSKSFKEARTQFTPAVMRKYLRSKFEKATTKDKRMSLPFTDSIFGNKVTALATLDYCLSDLPSIVELNNLPLCFTLNDKVAIFNTQYQRFIPKPEHQIFLEGFADMFISSDIYDKIMNGTRKTKDYDIGLCVPTKSQLLERLSYIYPKIYYGKDVVKWDYSIISKGWIQDFWKLIGSDYGVVPTNYPLIPTDQNELVSLSQAKDVLVPFKEARRNIPTTRNAFEILSEDVVETKAPEVDPAEKQMKILKKLNCRFLNISETFMHTESQHHLCVRFKSVDFYKFLIAIPPRDYQRLNGFERTQILLLLQNATPQFLNDNRKKILSLPLFETAPGDNPDFLVNLAARAVWDNLENYPSLDPELVQQLVNYGQEKFINASTDTSVLPLGVPYTGINKRFLKYQNQFSKLYKNLEIEVINKAIYFKNYVLPGFEKLPPDQKYSLMLFVKNNYSIMTNELHNFKELLMKLPFVETLSGKFAFPTEMVNLNNKTLHFIYDGNPDVMVAPKYNTLEWINILENLGMICEPDITQFTAYARKIATLAEEIDVFETAEDCITNLFQYLSIDTLHKKTMVQLFFSITRPLAIYPAIWNPNMNLPKCVRSIENITIPQYSGLCWTVLPYFPEHLDPPIHIRKMMDLNYPSIEIICRHLSNIVEDYMDKYSSWEELKSDIFLIFQFLSTKLKAIKAKLQKPEFSRKEVLEPVDPTPTPLSDNVHFEHKSKKYLTSQLEVLKNELTKVSFIPIELDLVGSKKVFFKVEQVIPNFIYRLPEELEQFKELLELLGVRERPCLEDYIDILQSFTRNPTLNPYQVQIFLSILEIVTKFKNFENYLEKLLVPDVDLKLRLISEVVLLDSTWLYQRILPQNFHFLHSQISLFIAQKLKIRKLSEVVLESIDPDITIEIGKMDPKVANININLNSEQFTSGLRRIIYHEEKHFANVELQHKIASISRFQITPVKILKSRFMDRRTNKDITSEAFGSYCILDTTKYTFFVLEELPNFINIESLLSKEINSFLGFAIKDLLPLQAILVCHPSSIHKKLDFLRVTSINDLGNVNMPLNLSESTILNAANIQSLNLCPIFQLNVSDLVAWKHNKQFHHAVVVSKDILDMSSTSPTFLHYYTIRVEAQHIPKVPFYKLYRYNDGYIPNYHQIKAFIKELNESSLLQPKQRSTIIQRFLKSGFESWDHLIQKNQ